MYKVFQEVDDVKSMKKFDVDFHMVNLLIGLVKSKDLKNVKKYVSLQYDYWKDNKSDFTELSKSEFKKESIDFYKDIIA
jgi:hypothetical protein